MAGSSCGSGTGKIMRELCNIPFKSQPVNITVQPPYQQEWNIPFLAIGKSLDCFAFNVFDGYLFDAGTASIWCSEKLNKFVNIFVYLRVFYNWVSYRRPLRYSAVIITEIIFLWIRTGTALIHEEALRFSSSLLPGRASNLGLNLRQAGANHTDATLKFSTGCVHGDKFYDYFFMQEHIWTRMCGRRCRSTGNPSSKCSGFRIFVKNIVSGGGRERGSTMHFISLIARFFSWFYDFILCDGE